MFKHRPWRHTAGEVVSSHQEQALNTTMLLLKSFGPTGFLLREEGEDRNVKVFLGDPHTCTCPVFTKEQELCKHICWVLLRKFKLPREHEYTFQLGLVERQILEVLYGSHEIKAHRKGASGTTGRGSGSVGCKAIQSLDQCPICQEELLEKKHPVAYCRFTCGNSVHISCMKVWADHQKLSHETVMVKCPLCRGYFSSLKVLREQVKNAEKLVTAAEGEKPDRHLGVVCHGCRACPITGRCFKCTVCSHFYLCEDCAQKAGHPEHPLASRAERREKWCLVDEDPTAEPKGATSQQQNDSNVPVAADPLPDSVLEHLPSVIVRSRSRLLGEGLQCRICLQSFRLGQSVRKLPCHHQFHVHCVDPILRKSNCCPLDGYVVYNPLTFRTSNRKTSAKLASSFSSNRPKPQNPFIPGVGLRGRMAKVTPSHGALHSEVLTGHSVPLNTRQQQNPTLRHCMDERGRAASAESYQPAAREQENP